MRIILTNGLIFTLLFTSLFAQTPDSSSYQSFQLSVSDDILKKKKVENPKMQVFSADKIWKDIDEVPQNVWVITREDIRMSGALNIAEALRLCPFLLVRQGLNGVYDVKMLNNLQTQTSSVPLNLQGIETGINFLLLIDNMPYNDDLKGNILWETLPVYINDVEQIEIIIHPSSSKWGGNAAQGIIHILTLRKEKGSDLQVDANFQGGLNNTFVHSASARIGIGETWHFKLSGNYQSYERFERTIFLFSQNRFMLPDSLLYFDENARTRNEFNALGKQSWGANFYTNFTPNKKYQVDLHVFAQNSNVQGYWEDTDINLVTRSSNSFGGNLNAQLLNFRLQGSYLLGTRDFAVGYMGRKFNFSQLNTSLSYDYTWKKLRLLPEFTFWSANYDDTSYPFVSENITPAFNNKSNLSSLAGSLQAHYTTFKDKLLLGLAIRAEKFNQLANINIAPEVSALYKIDKNNVVSLLYTQGYRRNFVWEMFVNQRDSAYIPSLNRPVLNFVPATNNLQLTQTQQFSLNYQTSIITNLGLQAGLMYQLANNFATIEQIGTNDNNEAIVSLTNVNASLSQVGVTGKIFFQNPRIYTSLGGYWNTTQTQAQLSANEQPNWILNWQGKLQGILQGKLNVFAYVYAFNAALVEPTTLQRQTQTFILPNLKVSFKIFQGGMIYLNARNIGSNKMEISYFETLRANYLAGIELNF